MCFEKLENPIPEGKEVTVVDLINDVFKPVYKRVLEKKADLIGKQKKATHGFECWLPRSAHYCFGRHRFRPDVIKREQILLSLMDETELKAESGFSFDWIIEEGALKHKAPVLFLSGLKRKNKIKELEERPDVKVLHYKYLSDGKDDWILGLIEPIQFYIDKHK